MIFDRLKNVVKSYVMDFVEKGEQKFGMDPDLTDDEFEEWKREQYSDYEKKYRFDPDDDYSSSSRSSKPSAAKKKAQYFKDLELDATEDFDVIKKQYRKMMKKWHPDRFQNEPEKLKKAEKLTAKLNEAFAYFEKIHGKK